MPHCHSCHQPARQGDKFCGHCGAANPALPPGCPNCGAKISAGARFCGGCGTQLAGSPPPAATPASNPAPGKAGKASSLGVVGLIGSLMVAGLLSKCLRDDLRKQRNQKAIEKMYDDQKRRQLPPAPRTRPGLPGSKP